MVDVTVKGVEETIRRWRLMPAELEKVNRRAMTIGRAAAYRTGLNLMAAETGVPVQQWRNARRAFVYQSRRTSLPTIWLGRNPFPVLWIKDRQKRSLTGEERAEYWANRRRGLPAATLRHFPSGFDPAPEISDTFLATYERFFNERARKVVTGV